MGDDIDEEIKRAQQERENFKGASFGLAVAYDEDLYSGAITSTDLYVTSIGVDDEEEGSNSRVSSNKDTVRKALSSYTAPKHLLEHRPRSSPGHEEDDPLKERKRKTVAEREDEYRARWRKRKLSPPRNSDPFTPINKGAEGRSYRDAMLEVQLEREKHEVMQKIAKKQKEEEELKKKEALKKHDERVRNGGSRSKWDVKLGGQWVINVFKNGTQIGAPVMLQPDVVYKIGRDRASHITLDHPSCSKQHASIQFRPKEGARTGDTPKPHIMDLGSTNGTFLNDQILQTSKFYELMEGDVVKFGGSTREYVFFFRE
jgi:smad nuclear-interacting protein 1